MKLKTTLIFLGIVALIGMGAMNNAYTSSTGAPGNYSGAPGDGTCASCHFGGASAAAASLSTNIDTSGYIPGQKYTISVSVADSSCTTFGFEVSSKAKTGGKANGAIAITNSSQTHLASTNHVTHTFAGRVSSNHTKKWSFQWTAPIAGSGNIGIYGAFIAANGNGSDQGDVIVLKNITVKENVAATAGIAISGAAAGKVGVYPNPVNETLHCSILLEKQSLVNISLFDLNGHLAKVLTRNTEMSAGMQQMSFGINELSSGLYILNVNTSNNNYFQKVIIE